MKNKIILFILFLGIVFLSNCKKYDNDGSGFFDHKKWTSINVGDSSNTIHLEINDTIAYQPEKVHNNLVLDINNDSNMDMELISERSWFLGQSKFNINGRIKTFKNCEILVDTSLQKIIKTVDYHYPDTFYHYTSTIYSKIQTPKILEYGNKIGNNGIWQNDEYGLYFSYSKDKVISINSPNYEFENQYYDGWGNLNNKYLGFRIFIDQDTLYGWMKINIKPYNWINIEEISYR